MIDRSELQDAARKAFPIGSFAPDAGNSWALIAEMGWLMMVIPEDLGGLGLGTDAQAVVHVELGRALVPGPVIAQLMVIEALCAADALPERDDLLMRAMSGEVMTASLAGAGMLRCVPDADKASHVLVVANDRVSLHNISGAPIVARDMWDKSRRLFDVSLPDGNGFTLAEGAAGAALADRIDAILLLGLAGDSIGGAAAILDLTIDYLKTRRQFDRPLAMFQALKHRVADLKMRLAAAEALFWSCAAGDAKLIDIGALKAHAAMVYADIAEDAIQLHGGIGLTSEYHCHLFLKRAMLNATLGGDGDRHHEAKGRSLLLV